MARTTRRRCGIVRGGHTGILERLGDAYVIQTWKELNAPIYTALSYEKLLSAMALLIVIIIAALNIITVLVMIVMEKARDI